MPRKQTLHTHPEKGELRFDLGIPNTFHFTDYPDTGGAYLLRNYRRRQPSAVNSLMAMYAELFTRSKRHRGLFFKLLIVGRGHVKWPRKSLRTMMRRGLTARRAYQRSLYNQAADIWRAWQTCALTAEEYYEGQLARHAGGPQITGYLPWKVLSRVAIQLQRDTFGEPPFLINDKSAFGNWCRANGIRSPREIALNPGDAPPSPEAITALGRDLFVKPRSAMKGDRTEAWQQDAHGLWRWRERSLDSRELAVWFAESASAESNGIVVQERFRNHESLTAISGTALSTCRIVTVLNENNEPEIVECLWRMATRPSAIVDNYNAGGTYWVVRDFETGEIALGVHPDSTNRQDVIYRHPVTDQSMAGEGYPFWAELRQFALGAHKKLGNLVVAGWDIAMTPDGPAAVELNFPPAMSPRTHMVWDGLENSRLGEILAWHARHWISHNIDKNSRNRIAADVTIR